MCSSDLSTPSTSSGLGKIDVAPLGTEQDRPYKTYSASQTTSSVKEVKDKTGDGTTKLDAAYDVAIKVTELEKNTAGGKTAQFYVGIAIPEKKSDDAKTITYKYYVVTVATNDGTTTYTKGDEIKLTDGYYYFDIAEATSKSILVEETVTEKAATGETDPDTDTNGTDTQADDPTNTGGTGSTGTPDAGGSEGDGGDDTTTTDPVPDIFNYLINVTVAPDSSKKEVGEAEGVAVKKGEETKTDIVSKTDTTITTLGRDGWGEGQTTTEYSATVGAGEDAKTVTADTLEKVVEEYNKVAGDENKIEVPTTSTEPTE